MGRLRSSRKRLSNAWLMIECRGLVRSYKERRMARVVGRQLKDGIEPPTWANWMGVVLLTATRLTHEKLDSLLWWNSCTHRHIYWGLGFGRIKLDYKL